MARKVHKIPARQRRRLGAPAHPLQAERDFAKALVAMAAAYGKKIRAIFLPLAKKIGRPPPAERRDAADEKAARAASRGAKAKAEAAASAAFTKARLRAETDRAARRVEAHSKDQFRRLGVNPKKEPVLSILVQGWARDISERVADLGKDQARKLEAILLSGHSRYADTLAREIEEQIGVTASRAEFIARDSVGTLNSKITRERFRAAEIEFYVWTTMADDRVREAHEKLDGAVFEVEGPGDPDEGHPGEPPNCRCVQYPMPRDKDEPADEPKDEDEE